MLAGHGAARLAAEAVYAPREALSALPPERRLALFEAFAPSLAGPEREALQAAARELGVLEGAERRCASRSWLADDRPEVRAQAAEWAAAHPDPAVVERLELVCAIDSDTLVEADVLQRMIRPFLASDEVVAVGGTIRAVNGCEVRAGRVVNERPPHRLLPALQAVEYLRAFLAGRLGRNRLGGNLVISGAFGRFQREPMIAAGGYLHETVGEDMEVVVRTRRLGRGAGTGERVVFVPDPVAWTEVPERARILARRRNRWHHGLADVLRRHQGLAFNPRHGRVGLLVYPYFLLIELLAPVVELVGLVAVVLGLLFGAVNVPFAILFLLVAYGFGLLLTAWTLVLEEWTYRGYGRLRDRVWLLLVSLLEGLGYRQMTAVWRLRGLIGYPRGRREWGVMTRSGFTGDEKASA